MTEWIAAYGYPLLFVGTIIEGEAFLLAAAVLARNGVLGIWPVMAVSLAGALSGDLLFFAIGLTRGAAFLERRPRWRRRIERLSASLHRFEAPLMLGFRFWYGMRAVIPLAFGLIRTDPTTFIRRGAIGALLWVGVIAGLGFWAGAAVVPVVAVIQASLGRVLCAGLTVATACLLVAARRSARRRAVMAAPDVPHPDRKIRPVAER